MDYDEFKKTYGLELAHAGEIWQRRVYTTFKEARGTVFDVGSTDGCFAIYALLHGASRAYAFEASASREYEQQRIIERLGLSSRITSLHVAVGNKNEDVKLFGEGDWVNGCRCTYDADVTVRTLDKIVQDFNVEKVDFVKIDIEGGELLVLLGAMELISRDKPVFSIASYHSESYKANGEWNSESQLNAVLQFFATFFPEYVHDICFDIDGTNPIVTFWVNNFDGDKEN